MGKKLSIEEIVKSKVDEIKWRDIFITKWLYEGREIDVIKMEIAERNVRIHDLKYYCKENNMKFEDYYTDRLSRGLPNYGFMEILKEIRGK